MELEESVDAAGMALEGVEEGEGGEVPEFDGFVPGGGDEEAIG